MLDQLNERIAALRKERGFTLEQLGQMVGVSAQAVSKWEKGGAPDVSLLPAVADALGVSIDSLFGRVEEGLDVKAAVRRWMLTFPEEQRMDRLCHFIWSVMSTLSARSITDAADWDHYVDHCRQASIEADDKTYRMLERTRVMLESGLLLGVRANDMSYLAIFPEPKAGWEPFLESNDLYRRLFALLARPHCLELLEYLHSKPSRYGRNFMAGAVVKQTGFDAAEVESLLGALAEMNLLMVTELETEEGLVSTYCMYETECLVPLLSLASYLASGNGITNGQNRRSTPVLRGEKWKEMENLIMRCYFVKNWKRIALPLFLAILYSGIFTLWQLGLMRLFDAAARLDLDAFLTWTVIELAGITLYYGVLILENIAEARAVRALNNQVRHDLYLSLMEKSHSAYHSQDTGEYISWLTSNVKQIERLAWSPFFSFASCITVVLFNIAALASLHWVILLAGLASTAVMLVLPKLFQKRMERLGEVCAAAEEQGAAKLKDILSGFDVLRSFGRADRFLRQGDAVSRQIEDANCRRTCMQTSSAFLVGLTGNILMLLQMVIAVFLALQGKVILGAIVGAGNLTGGITNGLQNLASCRMSLASAKPYFDKITVHAGEQSAREAEGLSPVREAIAVENISFCYGEKPVLSALSATFEKGGKYALTGPSGCGKSTLLKLLLGWLPGYEGTIFFDGQDAKSYTPEQLQTQMSYIEQDVFLFNTTIRENITLGEDFTEEQLQKALQDSALAGDLAHMPLGLDTPVGEEGSALSGGQKQRVAIARALIHDRSILLVDEGTSALDQKNADIVEKSLLSNPDLTLILVSHHLTEERQKQFDRVFEM